MADRSCFTIPPAEKKALKEIARITHRTETEVVNLLIRWGAQKCGIEISPRADAAGATDAPASSVRNIDAGADAQPN